MSRTIASKPAPPWRDIGRGAWLLTIEGKGAVLDPGPHDEGMTKGARSRLRRDDPRVAHALDARSALIVAGDNAWYAKGGEYERCPAIRQYAAQAIKHARKLERDANFGVWARRVIREARSVGNMCRLRTARAMRAAEKKR
jgi:hypothetical protein